LTIKVLTIKTGLLFIISSCSILQIGSITDLYKHKFYTYKDFTFLSLDTLDIKTKHSFSFFYLVNFDCEKNTIPKIEPTKNEFYLIENSVLDIEKYYFTLKAKTNSNTFYYLPEKGFKNPNKDFETFLTYLRNDYIIEQNGYFVKAIRK